MTTHEQDEMNCKHAWNQGTLSASGIRGWVCGICQARLWSVTDKTALDYMPTEREVFQIRKAEGWGEDLNPE